MKVDYQVKTMRGAVLAVGVLLGLVLLPRAIAQQAMVATDRPGGVVAGVTQSIVFTSNRDGNNEIYAMDPDGENENRITDNSSNDQRPEISPDGSRIAFSSNRDGNFEIFVMDADDGGNLIQLTDTTGVSNSWPRWSPDGEWIAFQSGSGTQFQIYRIRPDRSGLAQVTQSTDAPLNQFPAWSPDGSRLAIRRNADLFLINSMDGSDPIRLTNQGTINQMAAWSPDGTQIAFMSDRAGYASVFVLNLADPGIQSNFTPKPAGYPGTWTSRAPAWSPNGRSIYFTAVRSASSGTGEQIFVKPAAGGDEAQLTNMGVNSEATVRRIVAPTINSLTATPDVLWPPKNQMVPVAVTADVTDNSDPEPVCEIADVTSSEFTLEPFSTITGRLTLDLRAQRFGMWGGRVYTITVTCTNSSELSSSASVEVFVPHDVRR